MEKRHVTRIDLERIGQSSVMVQKWFYGWQIHDAGAPDVEEFHENASIAKLLEGYEKDGFCVWMSSSQQGRALKGQITRIDVVQNGEWEVKKYPYGWSAKTPPIEVKKMSEQEARSAIQWLKDNHWTVMEHPNWQGARAFRGKPMPVHDKFTIQSMRRKAMDKKENYTADFAYLF